MENWQKELKEHLGSGAAEVYKGSYYGNAANPVLIRFQQNSGLPDAVKYVKITNIIATNILPKYQGVSYTGKLSKDLPFPYYTGDDILAMVNFAREVNSVKGMNDDSENDGGNSQKTSGKDWRLVITIIIVTVLIWMLQR